MRLKAGVREEVEDLVSNFGNCPKCHITLDQLSVDLHSDYKVRNPQRAGKAGFRVPRVCPGCSFQWFSMNFAACMFYSKQSYSTLPSTR